MGILRDQLKEKLGLPQDHIWPYFIAAIIYITVIIGGLLIINYSSIGKRTYTITEEETGRSTSFTTEYFANFVGIAVIVVGVFDLLDITIKQ